MDGARFDLVTRTVTAAGSRRGALSALLGGALGLALGASSVDEGMAKKKKCPPCKKRKQGKCKKNLPDGTACSGGACQRGRCVAIIPACPEGFITCRGVCTDPAAFQADDANCGACGHICGAINPETDAGEICVGGACVPCRASEGGPCNYCCRSTGLVCCDAGDGSERCHVPGAC